MKSKLIEKYLSLLLVFVMMITLMPQAAYARNREIIPTVSGNSLNMSVSNSGTLTWDDVPGANGYRVVLTKPNFSQLYHWDVTDNYLTLTTEMDGLKYDSGQYTLSVQAKGVSGVDDTMSYYYTSHVDKLESPNNLVWIGDKAAWDAVEGATSYNVSLYDFSGRVVTIPTTSTLYDFEGSSPEDGWTFRVQAVSNGTWSAKRNSEYTESPAKGTRTRTINAINSNNSLNMSVSNSGTLTWDDVPGANGYRIVLTQPNISELYHWDVTDNYLILTTEMDGYKCDSGQYTISVTAKGVSGVDDTMSYYYTSHVDKLESPNNLVWIGDKAAWDAVEGATSYNVSLYNFSGKVATIPTTGTLYDFEASSPEDGWTFRVQAVSNGTWSAERYSDYTESPAKETVVSSAVYNIGAYVYDDTLDALDSGGQISLTTDKGTNGWSDEGYIKEATEGTTVTLNAVAAEGYEFVEWRQGTGGVTISTDANYEFAATENKFLYAIFRKIAQSTTQITSANAIITVPVAGATPDFSPAADDSLAYTVEVDTWYLVDSGAGYPDLEANSRFEAGKVYAVRVIFTAKDGYEFTNNTTYTVNGNDTFRYGITNNYVQYEFVIPAPKTYMVSYSSNGGSGTMVGDIVTENDSFTLDPCDYEAPEGYKFKAWAIGSVNGEQKQPGEKIAITGETIIYAIWEAVPEETPTKEPTETPTETPVKH